MAGHARAPLDLAAVRTSVGAERFDEASRMALADHEGSYSSDIPHEVADPLWFEGSEALSHRLRVAIEAYQLIPAYGQLMYWPYKDFDESTRAQMWAAYRAFLDDDNPAIAGPVMYSLWVDYFEDAETVDRAWREVAGPQEPRRPRLDRVVRSSGPVPWRLKGSIYDGLAIEGGWEDAIVDALLGSCIDIYGSLEREPALRTFKRLKLDRDDVVVEFLRRALADPKLPTSGADRRVYSETFMADKAENLRARSRRR